MLVAGGTELTTVEGLREPEVKTSKVQQCTTSPVKRSGNAEGIFGSSDVDQVWAHARYLWGAMADTQ